MRGAGPPSEQRGSGAGAREDPGEGAALDERDADRFAGDTDAVEQRGAHVHDEHLEQRYCPQCATELVPGRGPGGQPGCPACGFVRFDDPKVATGVVIEHEGRVLLVRRNHEPMMGRWTFPSGFVDAGEVVEAAARREAFEEPHYALDPKPPVAPLRFRNRRSRRTPVIPEHVRPLGGFEFDSPDERHSRFSRQARALFKTCSGVMIG